MIGGIVHVLKSGGRWIDALDVYGPRKTLYNRFVRWAARGVLHRSAAFKQGLLRSEVARQVIHDGADTGRALHLLPHNRQ